MQRLQPQEMQLIFGDSGLSSHVQLAALGSSTRGVIGGGSAPSTIGYYIFSSGGGINDFGESTLGRRGNGTANDSTRGLFAGGAGNTSPLNAPAYNIIDYVTIASTGDASDFGDMNRSSRQVAGCSSPIRGLFAGGYNTIPTGLQVGPGTVNNIIDYVTIQSKGDAKDFGDLTVARASFSGGSNATRGFIIGGHSPSPNPSKVDHISFLTTATLGNAVDFGNLTVARSAAAAVSSPTRVVNGGGQNPQSINPMDYFEISTTGNALDFGDLSYAKFSHGSTSNGHGGL